MKNPLINLILFLFIVSCTPKKKENSQADSGPFDLARLLLQENLSDLMAAQGIKPERKAASDETLLGLEIFRSSNPKVLRFAGKDLAGSTGKNKNHVLFHYDEESKKLTFYELDLYNQEQTDALINLLGKAGALTFKQTKLPKGSLEFDENGNAVKPRSDVRKTFRVWENKGSGLSYFLIETGSGQNLTTELIVLKGSEKAGKDWISFHSLDWYKSFKSE